MVIESEALHSILAEYSGQVGVSVLRNWGYSNAFASLIQHHRLDGEVASSIAVQVLREADLLTTIAGFGYGGKNAGEAADQLERLGYTAQIQEDFCIRIRSQIERLRYTFG